MKCFLKSEVPEVLRGLGHVKSFEYIVVVDEEASDYFTLYGVQDRTFNYLMSAIDKDRWPALRLIKNNIDNTELVEIASSQSIDGQTNVYPYLCFRLATKYAINDEHIHTVIANSRYGIQYVEYVRGRWAAYEEVIKRELCSLLLLEYEHVLGFEVPELRKYLIDNRDNMSIDALSSLVLYTNKIFDEHTYNRIMKSHDQYNIDMYRRVLHDEMFKRIGISITIFLSGVLMFSSIYFFV